MVGNSGVVQGGYGCMGWRVYRAKEVSTRALNGHMRAGLARGGIVNGVTPRHLTAATADLHATTVFADLPVNPTCKFCGSLLGGNYGQF